MTRRRFPVGARPIQRFAPAGRRGGPAAPSRQGELVCVVRHRGHPGRAGVGMAGPPARGAQTRALCALCLMLLNELHRTAQPVASSHMGSPLAGAREAMSTLPEVGRMLAEVSRELARRTWPPWHQRPLHAAETLAGHARPARVGVLTDARVQDHALHGRGSLYAKTREDMVRRLQAPQAQRGRSGEVRDGAMADTSKPLGQWSGLE